MHHRVAAAHTHEAGRDAPLEARLPDVQSNDFNCRLCWQKRVAMLTSGAAALCIGALLRAGVVRPAYSGEGCLPGHELHDMFGGRRE